MWCWSGLGGGGGGWTGVASLTKAQVDYDLWNGHTRYTYTHTQLQLRLNKLMKKQQANASSFQKPIVIFSGFFAAHRAPGTYGYDRRWTKTIFIRANTLCRYRNCFVQPIRRLGSGVRVQQHTACSDMRVWVCTAVERLRSHPPNPKEQQNNSFCLTKKYYYYDFTSRSAPLACWAS